MEDNHSGRIYPGRYITVVTQFVALGKLGGKKGGKARAESLTAKRRKEIAQKAAAAR